MSDELDVANLDPRVRWLIDEARQSVTVDADAKTRLMAAIRAEPLPVREVVHPRAWKWAVERRTLRMSPLLGGALAAGLVGIGVIAGLLGPGSRRNSDQVSAEPSGEQTSAPALAVASHSTPHDVFVEPGVVKFVFVAPSATNVALVGDFNGWNPDSTPMKRTGGTWTVTVPLRTGRHLYSFVVDGTQWLPDPSAPLAAEDGFGHSNSVVLVGIASS
jgi:hypothetical protein